MNDALQKVVDALNSLYGLPGIMVVFLATIVFGYVLRFIKRFPNQGIPLACWLFGGVFLPLISQYDGKGLRIWLVRNVLVGLAVGFVAWIVHNQAISRIEDWVMSKIPGAGGSPPPVS